MCQAGCPNENYWGDCSLNRGYCPIELKDHLTSSRKKLTKNDNLKINYRKSK